MNLTWIISFTINKFDRDVNHIDIHKIQLNLIVKYEDLIIKCVKWVL